jgi:transposase
MAQTRRLLPHQRLAIAREYEKGVSAKALAARYGVSPRTINYTVRAVHEAKTANRSRTRTIGVRVTDQELQAFDEVLERHGIENRTDGLRALIHAANGMFVSDAELKDELYNHRVALNRIGNNVSQIAKRLNEAKLKGQRPPLHNDDLSQIRSLAGMVMGFGDQLQSMILQRRNVLSLHVSKALKAFGNGSD